MITALFLFFLSLVNISQTAHCSDLIDLAPCAAAFPTLP